MAQTKYKIPQHIKQAVIWHCKGYQTAVLWLKENYGHAEPNKNDYSYRLVRAVDAAMCNVGNDIANEPLRQKLRAALWENTLNGRKYPYEILNVPTVCRDDFYERKRKFIKDIAINMGFIDELSKGNYFPKT